MNLKSSWLRGLAIAALLGGSAVAKGEDIDLFVGSNPAVANSVPNVLFILDNTANWNTPFTNEKTAVANVFSSMPTNPDGSAKFNVGLMMASETGQGDATQPKGGYIRAAIRPMNTANRAKYAAMITNFDVGLDKSNTGLSALGFAEAYRYFVSGAAYSGHNHVKTDYLANVLTAGNSNLGAAARAAMNAIYALPGNALQAKAGPNYTSPLGAGCGKTYIIFFSNGPAQDSTSNTTDATNMLTAAGGVTTAIPISPSGSQTNMSDEWSRFLFKQMGVTSFTIEANPQTTGQAPGWTALMKSVAGVSGGKYYAVNTTVNAGQEISDAINKILSEIQAVNTVFASVSLPVSVNTQGTYLNQVYIGQFRPDADAAPRWNGNLKQYKLGLINNEIKLVDADNASAVNTTSGFIAECARSFWTPPLASVDSYWTFRPQGSCIPPVGQSANYYANSNTPDGSVVEKGGAGYKLRALTSRTVKTCSKTFASCTALTDFVDGNGDIDATTLGNGTALTTTQRTDLINWTIGTDLLDENINACPGAGCAGTEFRPSVHGDIVHSRPVALNFGTQASPVVAVFYGGNDGVFRAVNGNRTNAIGTVAAGSELFSFVPPEFFPYLKRLKDNAPNIRFPNTPAGDTTAIKRNYGVDGPVVAHQLTQTHAFIYSTMRRGGRTLYAFDATYNAASSPPLSITLKWKKGCPKTFPTSGTVDDTGCTGSFSAIGQTWSSPQVFKSAGYSSGTAPMVIMGGGYDPACEDTDPPTTTGACDPLTGTLKGHRVYVLDADTGTLLATFSTDRPVAADIGLATDLTTGLTKYAYVADVGGNIYRIAMGTESGGTFTPAAPAAWTSTKIASVGCPSTAACTRNRKFLFLPDVIEENNGYSILIGSGDREKPLLYTAPSSNDVVNYFFKIHDEPGTANYLSSESGTCGSAVICLNSLLAITSGNPTAAQLAAQPKGWYVTLASPMEQVVTSSITIFGTTTFSTHTPHQPSPGSCENDLGISKVYNVSSTDASSDNGTNERWELLPPVGLPPSPVAGRVTLDNGVTMPFCIGCDDDSPLEGDEPPYPVASAPSVPKARVYWYTEQ